MNHSRRRMNEKQAGDKEDFYFIFKTEFLLLCPRWPTKQQGGEGQMESIWMVPIRRKQEV